jgi:hypothetical protein
MQRRSGSPGGTIFQELTVFYVSPTIVLVLGKPSNLLRRIKNASRDPRGQTGPTCCLVDRYTEPIGVWWGRGRRIEGHGLDLVCIDQLTDCGPQGRISELCVVGLGTIMPPEVEERLTLAREIEHLQPEGSSFSRSGKEAKTDCPTVSRSNEPQVTVKGF